MGNGISSIKYINFEFVQKNQPTCILINTLSAMDQSCLIVGTIPANDEETKINEYVCTNKKIDIIIYGKNSTDMSPINKATQLRTLGFTNVSVYIGGLFEWLLLQDIYGKTEFKTTSHVLDILKYK